MYIISKLTRLVTATLLVAVTLVSCDVVDFSADADTYDGELLVKFNSDQMTLFAQQDKDEETIGVSALKPVGEDKTYNFTVVDTTLENGTVAVEGEDYELASNSFTIPADSTIGTIPITLIKESLKDNPQLFLKITSENAADYNALVEITLRQYFPYNQQEWVGDYNLVYNWWFGDSNPRVVSISADPENDQVLTVENMLGTGTDIKLNMDDSDPANFTVSFDKEVAWVHSSYGDVRMKGSGTFDAENYVISADAEHTVSAGSFGSNPFTLQKIQ
ncbi:DUF4843 domain-containing protein [Fodinibius halophilus]|uniref:DUF4843 domain-containing protein n=1 Tax=Fodinibius halophilus TaxID=1736908 RepID=A0A6M1T1L0_9BACT|nr:DUF4843 domain-containing protein [Fodinibius halophilus]NGP87869.1 DUF4843 domain-containing protein [Fodinibius halophilus]